MRTFISMCFPALVPTFLLISAGSVGAGPILGGFDVNKSVAVQTVDLFAGTPFNPTANTITVVLRASGAFAIERQTQVGSTIDASIPHALFQGVLPGPLPLLTFDLIAGTPDLNPSLGQFANVVQNPLDPGFATGAASSFSSGDFSVGTYFKLVLPIATLYSDPNAPALFTSELTGLPARPGTVFASHARINLYLQTGPGFDPVRDLLIGQSYDRTVTVVPEPSTFALGILAAALGLAGARRRGPSI